MRSFPDTVDSHKHGALQVGSVRIAVHNAMRTGRRRRANDGGGGDLNDKTVRADHTPIFRPRSLPRGVRLPTLPTSLIITIN